MFFQRRSTSAVSVSWAETMACLTLGWMGASMVHMKRVPMFMPSAPNDNAAASPCPSAKPPDAMNGISRLCRARERRMKFVMSLSPTWPAHSKPSMERKSTPSLMALWACRIVVHLWRMVQLAALSFLITGSGLFPAVSTMRMPSSMITWAYAW